VQQSKETSLQATDKASTTVVLSTLTTTCASSRQQSQAVLLRRAPASPNNYEIRRCVSGRKLLRMLNLYCNFYSIYSIILCLCFWYGSTVLLNKVYGLFITDQRYRPIVFSVVRMLRQLFRYSCLLLFDILFLSTFPEHFRSKFLTIFA
jgi:hypothetical protein